MLTGIEYARSNKKKELDKRLVHLIKPFALAAKASLIYSGVEAVEFRQTRIGALDEPFEAYKLRTLQDDGMTPVNDTAAFFRRSGMDELIQYKNILEGTMTVVGRRPLTPNEYDQAFDGIPTTLVDDYLSTVVPTRPGLVSTFVIATHLGTVPEHEMKEQRLIMDINDVDKSSRKRDKALFWSAVSNGLGNKMKHGAIRPFKAT